MNLSTYTLIEIDVFNQTQDFYFCSYTGKLFNIHLLFLHQVIKLYSRKWIQQTLGW